MNEDKEQQEPKEQDEAKCLACGNAGEDTVLLSCKQDGEDRWVCVRCLPMLIHGQH
jgi:hypothetical protein